MEKNRALRLTSTPIDAPETVVAKVAAMLAEGLDGWVQYASGVEASIEGKRVTTGDGARGLPLAAEWRRDAHRSAHLRQQGDGWTWTEAVEEDGEGCVHEEVVRTNLPRAARRSRMVYRTGWVPAEADAHGVRPLTPVFSRFCGWKD